VRGLSPRTPFVVGGWSLPCGATMLRVVAPHEFACG